MRARGAIIAIGIGAVGLLFGGGCMREPAGPTVDMDELLDQDEARAFCDRWTKLAGEQTPQAALARARLALQLPRSVAGQVKCADPAEIPALAAQSAEEAIKGLPQDPQAWGTAAAWRMRMGDRAAGAAAACRAAELAPRDPDALEMCGDAQAAAGDVPGATKSWQSAVLASSDREQQFELLQKIDETSLQPTTDLNALPGEVVEQYRQWRAARATRSQSRGHRWR